MAEKTGPPMTDEERQALCQKMDQDLDDFINSLERRRYTDGWAEDKWEEEMDKHPFFMKTSPSAEGEVSPLAEGLAKLKYDPEENTPLELATNYKEDGNYNYKHKNYRLAIMGYTEGIRLKCDSPELNASLYNNRAAAHWELKNYRSAFVDSEKAISINPNHIKARLRAARAALQMNKFTDSTKHLQMVLEIDSSNKEAADLFKSVKRLQQIYERDQRKRNKTLTAKEQKVKDIIQAIVERGVKIANCDDVNDLDMSVLEVNLPGLDSTVTLEEGILKWPVLFLFPEHHTSDLVKGCPENVPLINQLEQLFPAPWDPEMVYTSEKVNLYIEGTDKVPHIIKPYKNLGDLLLSKHFEVKGGTPAFLVVPRGSKTERLFLESYIKN